MKNPRRILSVAVVCLGIGLSACKADPFDQPGLRVYIEGTISSRDLQSMYVVDNPANPGQSAYFSYDGGLRVLWSDGATADTSALQVGRRVSVYLAYPF